jgi:uncharacterized membrane protein
MVGDNLTLYAATYDDADTAAQDFQALKDAQGADDDFAVVGAVVINRPLSGPIDVKAHDTGELAGGAGLGAVAGLVVGLFAPPLLLSVAVGAGVGAGIGELVKRHEEKELGADLEEYLPPDSSAIVAVVDDKYLDRVENTLIKASKKMSKAIDSGDYDKVKKAAEKSADAISDAITS